MSATQLRVLHALDGEEWRTGEQVAETLGMSKTVVYNNLVPLFRMRLIERTPALSKRYRVYSYRLKKDCGLLIRRQRRPYEKRNSFNNAGDGMLRILAKTGSDYVRGKALKELKRRGLE